MAVIAQKHVGGFKVTMNDPLSKRMGTVKRPGNIGGEHTHNRFLKRTTDSENVLQRKGNTRNPPGGGRMV